MGSRARAPRGVLEAPAGKSRQNVRFVRATCTMTMVPFFLTSVQRIFSRSSKHVFRNAQKPPINYVELCSLETHVRTHESFHARHVMRGGVDVDVETEVWMCVVLAALA